MQGSQTSLFDSGEPELGDLTTPLSLLSLMEAPGIGPAKALAVARKFGTWESFLRADEATPVSYTHLTLPTKRIV